MPCFKIGGENKSIFFFKINIKTACTPRNIVSRACYSQHMVFSEKFPDPFINHSASICKYPLRNL